MHLFLLVYMCVWWKGVCRGGGRGGKDSKQSGKKKTSGLGKCGGRRQLRGWGEHFVNDALAAQFRFEI